MTNLDSILKSRDITLPTKVHLVKAMVFPVVTCGSESWSINKARHQRIDAFELWYWRRILRVPWTARRSNLWILKEMSPEYSLEGLMLKIEGRRRGRQRMRWLEASPTRWTWVWASSGSWFPGDREAWGAAVHGVTKSRTWLSNWTELNDVLIFKWHYCIFRPHWYNNLQLLSYSIVKTVSSQKKP